MLMNWCWWAVVVELLLLNYCWWRYVNELVLLNCWWWAGVAERLLMTGVAQLLLVRWCCSTYIDEFGLRHSRHTWSWGYRTVGGKVLMINRADVDELMRWVDVIYVRVIYSCSWTDGDELRFLNPGDGWCCWTVVMSWCHWTFGEDMTLMNWCQGMALLN